MIYFVGFLGLGMLALILAGFLSGYSKNRWWCDKMGWHPDSQVSEQKTFDGCSIGAVCLRCNREVLMDSQGNWF